MLSARSCKFRTYVNRRDTVKGTSLDGYGDQESFVSPAMQPRNPAAGCFFINRSANRSDPRFRISVILIVDQDSRSILFESFARVRIFAAPGSKECAWSSSPHLTPQQSGRNFRMPFEVDLPNRNVRPILDFKKHANS